MVPASAMKDRICGIARSLDDAVEEVFQLMMGMSCLPTGQCPSEEREMISAVIGLAGAMSGICVLYSGTTAALRMAETLTGAPTTKLNDTVKDAVGEICNMVAGAWKTRQPSLTSDCMLSTPTVVTGTNYQLHNQKPKFRVERFYCFESHLFAINLLCESLQ